MSQPDLLFVYGTLRRGCGGDEARALHAQAEWLGQGRLCGRLYAQDWYPALVADVAGANFVTGDLFRLHDPAVTLAWLDSYEECGPEFPEPQEYRRVIAEVEGPGGAASVRAWVYVYNHSVERLLRIDSGDWLCN